MSKLSRRTPQMEQSPVQRDQWFEGAPALKTLQESYDALCEEQADTLRNLSVLQEALEHVNEHITHYPNQPLDKGCRDRVRNALSPTKETDP